MVNAALSDSPATYVLIASGLSAPVLAIAAFVSTNVDDLFLLTSLFVDVEFGAVSVVFGQFLGMSILVVISILAALFTMSISEGWISLLGLAPLLLGINRLWKLFQGRSGSGAPTGSRPDFVGKERLPWRWARSEMVLVTLLTVANGGDNLSVYIPLFAVQRDCIPLYGLIIGVMTAFWCLLGFYLTHHGPVGKRVKRYGRFIVPFVLIGIGLHMLFRL
jgi:cadmium resistance protein CadD (predicted permease)